MTFNLNNLEVAPADELVMLRTTGTPAPIAPDSTIPRGHAVDDDGPVRRSHLTVLLVADGEVIDELPVLVERAGYLNQVTPFEASAPWDECWLTDGRVRVAARTAGPQGRVNGLVWK